MSEPSKRNISKSTAYEYPLVPPGTSPPLPEDPPASVQPQYATPPVAPAYIPPTYANAWNFDDGTQYPPGYVMDYSGYYGQYKNYYTYDPTKVTSWAPPVPPPAKVIVLPSTSIDVTRPPPSLPRTRALSPNGTTAYSGNLKLTHHYKSKDALSKYDSKDYSRYCEDSQERERRSKRKYDDIHEKHSERSERSHSSSHDSYNRRSKYSDHRDSSHSRSRREYSSTSSRHSSSSRHSHSHRESYKHSRRSPSHKSSSHKSSQKSSHIRSELNRDIQLLKSSDMSSSKSQNDLNSSPKLDAVSRDKSEDNTNDSEGKHSSRSRDIDDYKCSNEDDFYKNIDKNLQEESDEEEPVPKQWYRSSPADLYYVAKEGMHNVVESTPRGVRLAENIRERLIERGKRARPPAGAEPVPAPHCHRPRLCKHKSELVSTSESSSSSDSDETDHAIQELKRKQEHPRRLHPEMWFNDPGEMNDGPLCRCSARTRRQGIRHGVYAEELRPPPCDLYSNNANKLFHYRITISPPTNFLVKTLTIITHDEHEFLFSGFSLLSHYPLTKLPTCKVIRFNIEYTILYVEEQSPLNYTIEELNIFEEFLFREILELVDLDMGFYDETGCSQFHLLPRWERGLSGGGGEVLSVAEVLKHLVRAGGPLLPPAALPTLQKANQRDWQAFVDRVRGMIVTFPGRKPCSVRVDQLDRSLSEEEKNNQLKKDRNKSHSSSSSKIDDKSDLIYPEIVHFGIRPPQLSYAGNPEYKKAWRDYVKFRHLVANMPKPSYEDRRKLEAKEARLQEMKTQSKMKRDVTVAVSAEGFYRTGLMCDVVQHAMLIPVLISHLRFHNSLNSLEKIIDYRFENRSLLQLALTHPSYRENFGTNPDHARNSLTNCGIRQPEYGDRRIHYMNIRKRGINTLINIMSRFGKKQETESAISHNERLEFLGDAVVEFLSSIHLFRMFPALEEGGLATYRAAIVQNQHLAQLAKKLGLNQYMLYAHGSDLCHDLELRHAMANCFEALMGALFLDGGIDVADRVFGLALWADKPDLLEAWRRPRPHPLQEQEPLGDRRWLKQYPFLQNLTKFEDSIGVKFKHIRLLARAFTDRSMGFTNLTLGSNQRLEFLGDTVLQLISSEHLYKHFPEHHEGHLSLLRSSLVNNRTQAVVCDDLAMASYAVYHNPKAMPKTKDKADLLEAFLGALYIDKDIEYCHTFCSVCLFPRLREFIMNQEWNDPKSKLQQCCLTLRTMDGSEPDIPIYKVIECVGPTNTRVYTVAVYFRGERLASAQGHCIQEAEMNAAKQAIANSQNLFPQLDHQKRVIAKSMKHQRKKVKHAIISFDDLTDKNRNKERSDRQSSPSQRSDHSRRSERTRSRGKQRERCKKISSRSSRDKDKLPMGYRLDKDKDIREHSSSSDSSSDSSVQSRSLSSDNDSDSSRKSWASNVNNEGSTTNDHSAVLGSDAQGLESCDSFVE